MSTEAQQSGDGGGVAQAAETLSITDNRTGKTLRGRDHGRHGAGDGPAPDQGRRRRLRAHDLRPGVHEHRVVPVGDHVHRRRQGHPRVPRLSDRAARRALDLPRGGLPAHPRRAADGRAAARLDVRDHGPHVRARERQELHAGLPPRRPPDGDAAGLGRRPLDLLPRRQRHRRPRQPDDADHPADREDADAGRLRLPPLQRPALRLSRQRPQVLGQLPRDDAQDDRAEVRARSPDRACARHPVHPARRPRAELLDERGAQRRLLAGRPLLRRGRRHRRPLRPAARRRQRGRAADAGAASAAPTTSPPSSRASSAATSA